MPRYIANGMLKKSQSAVWISSGSHHTGIVTKEGELFMSGSTLHGKLGISNLKMMQIMKF
jgi:alpha-tubulin suppressor-like RCC1 family protein